MKILVIGPGCHKCKTLAQLTEQAVAELGISAEITKVTDLKPLPGMPRRCCWPTEWGIAR